MTRRRRHGPAGLLVALFVVGGLIFSYGLGHAPPPRVCTQHAVSVPVAAVSSAAGAEARDAGLSPLQGLHSAADAVPADGAAASGPAKRVPSQAPVDACLCLAVLFTLVLLGLAAVLRRRGLRLPARVGWALAPILRGASAFAPRPALQVLRL
ncbi:hypothetical protein [Actinomadura decatromicini]|uniref:Uncharacterized protein n=1 Tax=Actinomadura decatromicini TaxID=2604572 RepID=A0A5D3F418_9ACTN|nr:hypothetical protein [Actinomadura decatromicini]TYK42893.1 hypothetical protein FXF68_40620 [Actinomadura decatromicini]